jgi:predicted component of type VI protein secretion system
VVGPLDRHASSAAELKERLDAERAGRALLIYRDDDDHQRIIPLVGDKLTIGRGPGADLRVSWDLEVSRAHAKLERVGNDWAVTDDGLSTNGTFCNGERVRGRRRLRDGDQLRIGRTLIAFRAPTADGDTTALADDEPAVAISDTQRRVLVALCRPLRDSPYASPSTNQQIGAEVHLGVDAVKVHLRALYRRLGIEHLPQNEKRARLAELAFHRGLVSQRDLDP